MRRSLTPRLYLASTLSFLFRRGIRLDDDEQVNELLDDLTNLKVYQGGYSEQ